MGLQNSNEKKIHSFTAREGIPALNFFTIYYILQTQRNITVKKINQYCRNNSSTGCQIGWGKKTANLCVFFFCIKNRRGRQHAKKN